MTLKARTSPATKPYYRCLSCPQFRTHCSGLPTRDMNQEQWCEYMRDVKEAFHLTNAYIAQVADVSVKTVEKIIEIVDMMLAAVDLKIVKMKIIILLKFVKHFREFKLKLNSNPIIATANPKMSVTI